MTHNDVIKLYVLLILFFKLCRKSIFSEICDINDFELLFSALLCFVALLPKSTAMVMVGRSEFTYPHFFLGNNMN